MGAGASSGLAQAIAAVSEADLRAVLTACDPDTAAKVKTSLQAVSNGASAGGASATKPKVMTILHFNDVYNVEPRNKEPVGGIARFVTRIEELRDEAVSRGEPKAVVLFSGDAFNPSLTSTVTKGTHMIPALNAIGIEIACFGNHDFDHGLEELKILSKENNFPWLISNVTDKTTGRPLADGLVSRMLDFHGRKIGVMGLVEQEWLVTLATIEPGDVEYEDFCACGRRLAKELREQGAEAIVALTHMRVPNDEKLAAEVPEVDIILGGHDHHYDVKPCGPHGTYVLKSGTDFRDITAVRLEFQEGGRVKVLDHKHIEVTGDIKEEPAMKKLADECMQKVGAAMDVVLGEAFVDLDARFSSIRTMETNIGNFVADIMRINLRADLAVLNSGTLRTDAVIEAGPLKMKDLISLLPMLDELCVLELPGSVVLAVLENGVSQYPRLEGRFLQVSGVKFTYDATKTGGQRILEGSVHIAGEPLNLERKYKLVTKDYLRQGKDGFDMFKDAPCLADGEQAGILPTMVSEMFESIQSMTGEETPLDASIGLHGLHHSTRHAMQLIKQGVVKAESGKYGITPAVEGRIVCLNG
mmetsp:Transcript_54477/g.129851  ORF Transcript_54477/g.129851 Transcript_54477/m.129851 type:complete len:585 (+) Transcript_54477:108-1862(+)|eukprot:CAMPEP_0178427912 /NCGR_PEP_ID=MMETSP0689_2-20121128/29996_1 /TAXON_ID=160604 /ORGANISM="Amphidinium massartii, Strain CS-259" /LENGTH=584 /DNA_ID=CAMNT_0020049647 /DNA_START=21 /DNA_END=1775 /DNA_ORIENTATION=+